MQIRRAIRRDIADMMRIRGIVRENRLITIVITEQEYAARLDGNYATWVAVDDEDDRHLLGFASGDRLRANVWALFVDPDAEGQGVGSALHEPMMNWMFEVVERAWLTTEPNTRAERFYRANGWTEAGTEASGELRFELTSGAWTHR